MRLYQDRYKNGPHPSLGISSKMDVHHRAAVVLALELEMEYEDQLLIARRRLLRRRRRRAPRWWVRPWLTPARRLEYGHYNRLMQELRVEDENAFANYVRMPPHMTTNRLRICHEAHEYTPKQVRSK